MKKILFSIALSVASISSAMASETPESAPAKAPSSSDVGYYRTTCGIIVEGMSSSQFPTMDDFLIYATGLNAAYCGGNASLPDYSATPFQPEPNPETPEY